jgi:hypothetical protein
MPHLFEMRQDIPIVGIASCGPESRFGFQKMAVCYLSDLRLSQRIHISKLSTWMLSKISIVFFMWVWPPSSCGSWSPPQCLPHIRFSIGPDVFPCRPDLLNACPIFLSLSALMSFSMSAWSPSQCLPDLLVIVGPVLRLHVGLISISVSVLISFSMSAWSPSQCRSDLHLHFGPGDGENLWNFFFSNKLYRLNTREDFLLSIHTRI